jgi:hypothetical protein
VNRCPHTFVTRISRCDLDDGHAGRCQSSPDHATTCYSREETEEEAAESQRERDRVRGLEAQHEVPK